jgi:hypothetical protein
MRDNINISPSLKLFESYKNFIGGLNTEQSNDVLKDSETTILQNVDMHSKGSMRRREAYVISTNTSGAGPLQNVFETNTGTGAQGVFKYKLSTNSIFAIVAHNGKLYSTTIAGLSSYDTFFEEIKTSAGLSWTFQNYAMIDAVQYNDKMYVVTGNRIGVLTFDPFVTARFTVADLQATTINQYQATYAGYNLFDPSNDITNIFYSTISPDPDQFSIGVAAKGVIDKKANTAPDYKFCSHNNAVGPTTYTYAPSGFTTLSGYSQIIIGVQMTKNAVATVAFEKYTGTTWVSVIPDSGAVASTSAQGTFVFTIPSTGFTNFRVTVSITSGYVTVRAQPKFLLRNPAAGDTVRFSATWDAYVLSGGGPSSHQPANYQYKWEVKKTETQDYPTTPAVGYTAGAIKEYFDLTFDGFGNYDIRVTLKDTHASSETVPAIITPFVVYPEATKLSSNTSTLSEQIKKCTRCIVHWNRLILYYGDIDITSQVSKPNRMYISELDDFGYFPYSGFIDLVTDAAQPITSIVRHRNQLILFTPSSIYSMTGRSPSDYAIALINDRIGCDMPFTPATVENDILFANRDGIYRLRPSTYILDNFNVIPISDTINSQFLADTVNYSGSEVYGLYYNEHYHIFQMMNGAATVGQRPYVTVYKYNSQMRTWATDTIQTIKDNEGGFDFVRTGMMGAFTHLGRLICLFGTYLSTGSPSYIPKYRSVVAQTYPNINVYKDMFDHVYTMLVRTKFFDFSASFNIKKLKRLYLLTKTNEGTTAGNVQNIDLAVTVEADGSAVLDPEVGTVQNVFGTAVWTMTLVPNFHFYYGIEIGAPPVGNWLMADPTYGMIGTQPIAEAKSLIRGKCLRVRLTVNHTQAVPCEIVAAGFEFRLKKP